MTKVEILGSTYCNWCECIHNVVGIYENENLMTELVNCDDCGYFFEDSIKSGHVTGFNEKILAIRNDLHV